MQEESNDKNSNIQENHVSSENSEKTSSGEQSSEVNSPENVNTNANTQSSQQPAPQVEQVEEELDFVHTQEWKHKHKHVFILSEAGKPIYSR